MKRLTKDQVKEIISLHFEKKVSQTEIARRMKVSRRTINYHCIKNGVSPLLRDYGTNRIDTKKVIDLYLNHFVPMNEIAKRLGVSRRPILKRLRESGIVFRPPMSKIRRKEFAKNIPQLKLKISIWKAKVFERDKLKCVECGSTDRLEAHHIIPVRDILEEELLFDVSNGVTLCRKHHRAITYNEYAKVDTFRKLISSRSSV